MKVFSRILFGCLILLFAALSAWALIDAFNPFDDQVFDQKTWLQSDERRIPMAHDVVSRLIRNGMSSGDVTRLLGKPDCMDEGKDSGGNEFLGARTMVYPIGSSGATSFLGMDDAFVYIHLDDNGVVVGKQINGY